jgi:hypothetical protein
LLSAALVSAACGDETTQPAQERNDPGTGTRTMLVSGDIEGKDVPGGFVTDFLVKLRDERGNPISGATVLIRNANLGTVILLEEGPGSGDYTASRDVFASGDYRLDVVKGMQGVRGVVVGGMPIHWITSPAADDTVPAGAPLVIRWTRPSDAAGADVETRNYAAEGILDSGAYAIAAADNPARGGQRIRITRFNRVDIAGGLFGSRLTLKIRNSVAPVVVR